MKTSSKLTSKESFAILHKIENENIPLMVVLNYQTGAIRCRKQDLKQSRILFLKSD